MTRHRRAAGALALWLLVAALPAATYAPMSDPDLVGEAPIIVRVELVDQTVRVDRVGSVDLPFTIATLRVLETFKGDLGEETIRVRLPGGTVGAWSWSLPGTPAFASGGEFVLMLDTFADGSGERRLTEFGLAKFDLVTDEGGRRFAVRPVLSPEADVRLSRLTAPLQAAAMGDGTSVWARDAESFLAALRRVAQGEAMPPVAYASPAGGFLRQAPSPSTATVRTKWTNIGGAEPTNLFRWFWDTGDSPSANVVVDGTQTNLFHDDPCDQDANCFVRNAVTGWSGVEGTDVRLDGPSASGNVSVFLDAVRSHDGGVTWSTPFGCDGGIIGLGGPDPSPRGPDFKGDSPYYAIPGGAVSMRKDGCATTPHYRGKVFKTAVMHEIGHVLGLGHPGGDPSSGEMTSVHSTTSSNDWPLAVMYWTIDASTPSVPQTDDIQAIQYYYGTAPPGPRPVANFEWGLVSSTNAFYFYFSDTSANTPTGWSWDFGDPASGTFNFSNQNNLIHQFSAPGVYTVTLVAGSLNGSGTVSKTIVVQTPPRQPPQLGPTRRTPIVLPARSATP
jgi:hypothetical protein